MFKLYLCEAMGPVFIGSLEQCNEFVAKYDENDELILVEATDDEIVAWQQQNN